MDTELKESIKKELGKDASAKVDALRAELAEKYTDNPILLKEVKPTFMACEFVTELGFRIRYQEFTNFTHVEVLEWAVDLKTVKELYDRMKKEKKRIEREESLSRTGHWGNLCYFVTSVSEEVDGGELYEWTKHWPGKFPTKRGMKSSIKSAREEFGDHNYQIQIRVDWYEEPAFRECPPSGIEAVITVNPQEL